LSYNNEYVCYVFEIIVLRLLKNRRKLNAELIKKYITFKMGCSGYVERNFLAELFNLLKPTGHVMPQQFNIQQLYVLPTLYLCVFYLSENKQRLVPLTA
jgi:hypothetical protein